jgi:dTDP-4-amino-4,6-dideoxygalactose transaminase
VPDRGWYQIFRTVEASAPVGPYSMSRLSEAVLKTGIDYELVSGRRRSNYEVLADRLRALALYPELPAGVVPLGFPIRLARRDRVRQSLFERQIFAPTHWPIDGVVPTVFAASHDLAASILTLPCDQRYGSGDMERIADAVEAALSETRLVAEGRT